MATKDFAQAGQVSNPSGNVWDHPAAVHPPLVVPSGAASVGRVGPSGRKKVAVVGFSGATKDLAPYHDPEYEIWGLNQLYRHIPRADRWFDIHANYDEHVVEGTDHCAWIRNAPIPVYMNAVHPHYPSSVRFPIEATMDYFGQGGRLDYYTSTVAYMLALAIMEEFEVIGVYGIDLIAKQEYMDQKPCTEFYLGWAMAKGVRLEIPPESALMKQHFRYGYTVPPTQIIPQKDFIDRRIRLVDKKEQLLTQAALLDGAAQEAAYWANVYQLRERGGHINVKED